jgi:hypothetical protein
MGYIGDGPHDERTTLRPADLRRLAATTEEPERARKMLALAEQLEEKHRRASGRYGSQAGSARNGYRLSKARRDGGKGIASAGVSLADRNSSSKD